MEGRKKYNCKNSEKEEQKERRIEKN